MFDLNNNVIITNTRRQIMIQTEVKYIIKYKQVNTKYPGKQ